MQRASTEQLREICQGLISGTRSIKKHLDASGIPLTLAAQEPVEATAAAPAEAPAQAPSEAPECSEEEEDDLEQQLEQEVDKLDQTPKASPKPIDFSMANSVSHRKEWMSFGRRLTSSDAVLKYPEAQRLWEGSNAELWWPLAGYRFC